MRVGVHTNVWCNALFSDYKSDCTPKDAFNKNLPNWIITDMRFPNEMEAVEQRKGLTIRVIRPARQLPKGDGVFPTIQEYVLHPSETALDDAKFDYEIINDGSIEDLIEKVREVLTMEKII